MRPYSRKLMLTAEEISAISISLRSDLKKLKQSVKKASDKDKKEIEESFLKMKKLQQKFQRLAVNIEKEVLKDIKEINQRQ